MAATATPERRPTSVVLFEVINVLSALAALMFWQEGSPFGHLVEFLIVVGLTLWVTRGRSRLARAIYTGLALLTVPGVVAAVALGYIPPEVSSRQLVGALAYMSAQLAAVLLPFGGRPQRTG